MIKQDTFENLAKIVYLAIGSNLGNRIHNINIAKAKLELQNIKIIKCSGNYESLSWPLIKNPKFINIVIKIETLLLPEELLKKCNKIEKELSQLSSLSKINRTFLRNHLRHAKIVSSDDQGRLILTKNLIEYANILKDITIIGVLNKIEIWDNATLAVSDSEQTIDEESYEDLSKRVNI